MQTLFTFLNDNYHIIWRSPWKQSTPCIVIFLKIILRVSCTKKSCFPLPKEWFPSLMHMLCGYETIKWTPTSLFSQWIKMGFEKRNNKPTSLTVYQTRKDFNKINKIYYHHSKMNPFTFPKQQRYCGRRLHLNNHIDYILINWK